MWQGYLHGRGIRAFSLAQMHYPAAVSEILGMGFLHDKNNPISYGMTAKYAEDYSEENPVIKVTVTKPNGKEEYRININEVNPRNASEIEMFALCNYADANGIGTGGTFGSWQTLNYYRDNASHNGYFELTNGFASKREAGLDENGSAYDERLYGGRII